MNINCMKWLKNCRTSKKRNNNRIIERVSEDLLQSSRSTFLATWRWRHDAFIYRMWQRTNELKRLFIHSETFQIWPNCGLNWNSSVKLTRTGVVIPTNIAYLLEFGIQYTRFTFLWFWPVFFSFLNMPRNRFSWLISVNTNQTRAGFAAKT